MIYSQDVCSEHRQISENFLKVMVTRIYTENLDVFSLYVADLNMSFSFTISCHARASYFLSPVVTIQEALYL